MFLFSFSFFFFFEIQDYYIPQSPYNENKMATKGEV